MATLAGDFYLPILIIRSHSKRRRGLSLSRIYNPQTHSLTNMPQHLYMHSEHLD